MRKSYVGHALFKAPEPKWHQVSGVEEAGVRQFRVTDPNEYLIRFQIDIGRRAIPE